MFQRHQSFSWHCIVPRGWVKSSQVHLLYKECIVYREPLWFVCTGSHRLCCACKVTKQVSPKQIALEFKMKIQSLDMAQQSCSRQNNLTTSGFGKVAISVRHTYLDRVWRWRNSSYTTYWSHHSSIRHNMQLLCPQCLLPPRQTGRCVHQVVEVFALLQFCKATILQTCKLVNGVATYCNSVCTVVTCWNIPSIQYCCKEICDAGTYVRLWKLPPSLPREVWEVSDGMLCLHKTDGISYPVQYTYTFK